MLGRAPQSGLPSRSIFPTPLCARSDRPTVAPNRCSARSGHCQGPGPGQRHTNRRWLTGNDGIPAGRTSTGPPCGSFGPGSGPGGQLLLTPETLSQLAFRDIGTKDDRCLKIRTFRILILQKPSLWFLFSFFQTRTSFRSNSFGSSPPSALSSPSSTTRTFEPGTRLSPP